MNEKEVKTAPRYLFAVSLTPVMLFIFWQLEEIAKGSEIHYSGPLILNHFFVEIMFIAFIPLAFGTFLLLFSRIEEGQKLLKYILYSITILSLITTLFVSHSLATVPRGGKQNSFQVSPDTFVFDITSFRDGEYRGGSYQTIFTRTYPTSLVVALPRGSDLVLSLRLWTTNPVSLNGTVYLYIYLYRLADDFEQGTPLFFHYTQKTVKFEGSSLWTGEILAPEIWWGSTNENERMRLVGYKIGFYLDLKLEGSDYRDEIPFNADITASVHIIDFRVDSSIQNGVAILLCGVFVGIYVQILAKPVIRRAKKL